MRKLNLKEVIFLIAALVTIVAFLSNLFIGMVPSSSPVKAWVAHDYYPGPSFDYKFPSNPHVNIIHSPSASEVTKFIKDTIIDGVKRPNYYYFDSLSRFFSRFYPKDDLYDKFQYSLKNKTTIILKNISRNEVKNIELVLPNYTSGVTKYYQINTDSIKYLINSNIEIVSLRPNEIKYINLWGLFYDQNFEKYLEINFPNGFTKAHEIIQISTASDFDEFITNAVVKNQFVQICIYLFFLFGLVFFLFYIIPYALRLWKKIFKRNEAKS